MTLRSVWLSEGDPVSEKLTHRDTKVQKSHLNTYYLLALFKEEKTKINSMYESFISHLTLHTRFLDVLSVYNH